MKKGFKILLFLTLLYGCRADEKIILKNDIQLFKFKAHLDEDGNIGCLNALYGFDIKDTCLRNYLTKNKDIGERELGFFSCALDSSDYICYNNKYSNLDTFEIVCRKPTEEESGPVCLSNYPGPAPLLLYITKISKVD